MQEVQMLTQSQTGMEMLPADLLHALFACENTFLLLEIRYKVASLRSDYNVIHQKQNSTEG